MLLREFLGVPPLSGRFGIEVEVEGEGLDYVRGSWKTDADGSLRNGLEYILRVPLDLEPAKEALDELRGALYETEAKLSFSFRTSVHVHINCLELNPEQMKQFIYACLLLEPLIINYSGEERKHNRFCLSIKDADDMLFHVERLFGNKYEHFPTFVRQFNNQEHKYAAINLASLPELGSLEIRSMRGTLNKMVLNVYLEALNNIFEYATNAKGVMGIYSEFNDLGARGFVNKVLGQVAPFFYYEGMDDDLSLQASILITLPYGNYDGN